MSTAEENPYKVLGVERTADARAIKKAYVASIRKFSPESHPEEFKKIRAAYELLSDEDAKKRFDDGEKGYAEYGEDVAKRIADADEALSRKNPELAREILEELVAKAPDASVVREKLAFSYLSAGEHEKALAAFDVLAQKEPENARHHLHRAFALSRMQRTPQVEAALRRALELDPKDVRIALAACDFFSETGRKAEALAVVDAVLPTVPAGAVPAFLLVLRKVEVCALSGDLAAADAAIGELQALAAKAEDPELGPFVASQIASVAAKLFATSRSPAANHLLRWCEQLDPKSEIARPMPVETEVAPADLPEAFRTWLEGAARDLQSGFVVRGRTWALPVLALLASTVAWGVAFHNLRSPSTTFGVLDVASAFLFLGIPTFGVFLAGRWILRILTTPLRTVTMLHPIYVIHATPSRVRLYPVFSLEDVRGVHQHTNGVYSGTNITLVFGPPENRKQLLVSVYGKDAAQRWVDMLAAVRARALELLAEGALEAEPLVDLLPPGKLWFLPKPGGARRAGDVARPALAAAALAAALVPVVAYASVRGGEDEAYAKAASTGSMPALRAYLDANATSRHAGAARAALSDRASHLAAGVVVRKDDPGEDALARAVMHVRDHGGGIAASATLDGKDDPLARSHIVKALSAAGLHEILDDKGTVHVLVATKSLAPLELLRVPNADQAPKRPPPGATATGFLLVGGLATGSKPPPPSPSILVPVYEVEVSVDVPDAPRFARTVTTKPPRRLHAGAARPANAELFGRVLAREAALDAAVDALGLLGPVARLEGTVTP